MTADQSPGLTRRQWLTGKFLRPKDLSERPNNLSIPADDSASQQQISRFRPPLPLSLSTQVAGDKRKQQSRPQIFPVFRPPGAIAEAEFLAGCTRCGQCITACPYDAIKLAPASLRSAAGTPVIEAYSQPCWMCPDQPCVTACEPGVLLPDVPVKIGTAKVDQTSCLAWQKSFCTICEEQCPVPGAIGLDQGRPTIDPDQCSGCGVCLHVCPAPGKAILLTPTPVGKTN